MADQHHHPFLTTLKYGPAGGSATIALTDLQEAEPPETKFGSSDDTTLSSPGAVEQNSPGWGKNSAGKAKLYLMEAQHAALVIVQASRVNVPWLLTYAPVGNSTVGFMVAWTGPVNLKINSVAKLSDDKISVELELACSGAMTITIGSPAA